MLVALVPLALLCCAGTLFATWSLLFFTEGKGPFGHSLGLGLLMVAVSGLLAGFLTTVAWRLLSFVLGRKEAPYLFHPVIGVVLGVALGLMSIVAIGFLLATGSNLRRSAGAPVLFFLFAWQQARVLKRRRARTNRVVPTP